MKVLEPLGFFEGKGNWQEGSGDWPSAAHLHDALRPIFYTEKPAVQESREQAIVR
jgi:hypothetical protein